MTAAGTGPGKGHRVVGEHQWVGAALVDLGSRRGVRTEHASRTGRHVLPSGTRLQVLEVYCAWCRVSYDSQASTMPCTGGPAGVRPIRDLAPGGTRTKSA